MACSCFCWKRSFASIDRTPLPEYEENRKKILTLDANLNKLLRELDQVHRTWKQLGEIIAVFGKDSTKLTEIEDDTETKTIADLLHENAESFDVEMRNHELGAHEAASSRLLQYIKEFKRRIDDYKSRAAKMEQLAKDYDARRAVTQDKENANTSDKTLSRIRDLMYEAESHFREAETDILSRQTFILKNAPVILQASLVCFASIQSERIAFLTEKSETYHTIRNQHLNTVLRQLAEDVFPSSA